MATKRRPRQRRGFIKRRPIDIVGATKSQIRQRRGNTAPFLQYAKCSLRTFNVQNVSKECVKLRQSQVRAKFSQSRAKLSQVRAKLSQSRAKLSQGRAKSEPS